MFCALNGATGAPWLASHRHSLATNTLFPTSEDVPVTSSAPTIHESKGPAVRPCGRRVSACEASTA